MLKNHLVLSLPKQLHQSVLLYGSVSTYVVGIRPKITYLQCYLLAVYSNAMLGSLNSRIRLRNTLSEVHTGLFEMAESPRSTQAVSICAYVHGGSEALTLLYVRIPTPIKI